MTLRRKEWWPNWKVLISKFMTEPISFFVGHLKTMKEVSINYNVKYFSIDQGIVVVIGFVVEGTVVVGICR